jgi:polyferredoxin
MKKLFSFNFLSRVIFLLITPIFFQYFALGFIFHSIYWGVITAVVIIWGVFIIGSPLFGRIGCGWFCFMGTVSDFGSQHSIFKLKWNKPKIWIRLILLVPFFSIAILFYFYNKGQNLTNNFEVIPFYVKADFGAHYQIVWLIDIASALLLGLLLECRWVCKNLCFMGTLCAAGATYSRLIPVVDKDKCTNCRICEKECLVRIPIQNYIDKNNGLITNSECLLCGKCVEVCKHNAIKIKFVWKRLKQNSK